MPYFVAFVLFFLLAAPSYATSPSCALAAADKVTLSKAAFANMRILEQPIYGGDWSITSPAGQEVKLASLGDKAVLLNLWASWCGPCRQEMPALAALAKYELEKKFQLIPVNIDNSTTEKIRQFFDNSVASNLAAYRDKDGELFNSLRRKSLAFGLPVSLLFNKQHCLIAVVNGAAPWDNKSALNLMGIIGALP
ncbi:TlpA disulfide reductase family protein [Bartonella sp. TP]|uniref:TlpA disulfide reductase family protein n=1 Tax=Bartonella sp. TP TaxID=3057550 RepID=UPI0025B1D277|nr:TlpA disulfide reductase family protein [Bartonella sp. TP]MDN5248539.1 TlpA disulfide reductase family protein [Alphaproteobacteria bacterium]WJW79539.1 TlpA disulfide reductase family protein [Bartonella sp. TP]